MFFPSSFDPAQILLAFSHQASSLGLSLIHRSDRDAIARIPKGVFLFPTCLSLISDSDRGLQCLGSDLHLEIVVVLHKMKLTVLISLFSSVCEKSTLILFRAMLINKIR